MAAEVTATGATNIGSTTATFNGTANPDGVQSNAYFEYGLTTEYGSRTEDIDVGAGSVAVPVVVAVTGLQPGSTYHYRLVLDPGADPPAPPTYVYATFPADLAAYHASEAAGSTIVIPAGNNGDQTITLDKSMTFIGAPGAVLGDVTFANGSGHVKLQDMQVDVVTIGPWQSSAPGETPPAAANHITLQNLTGTKWLIRYADVVTVRGGNWSGGVGARCEIAPIQPWDGYNVSTDILVENGLYHDFSSTPSAHSEGILIYGANGVTIRGASFDRIGGTGDIGLFFVDAVTAPADFILLANIRIQGISGSTYWQPSPNAFDAYFNMQISNSPAIPNVILSGNSLPKTATPDPANSNPPFVQGIRYFSRSVPGGTPKTAAPPPGWGR